MKLPRSVGGDGLVRALARVGYTPTCQSGSHVRLTTDRGGDHHVSVPLHAALRPGTLASILADVSDHLGLTRDELLRRLDL